MVVSVIWERREKWLCTFILVCLSWYIFRRSRAIRILTIGPRSARRRKKSPRWESMESSMAMPVWNCNCKASSPKTEAKESSLCFKNGEWACQSQRENEVSFAWNMKGVEECLASFQECQTRVSESDFTRKGGGQRSWKTIDRVAKGIWQNLRALKNILIRRALFFSQRGVSCDIHLG